MTDQQQATAHIHAYRIGTAARLAGIPVATLRVWERRYGVVGPAVSASGHRRYSAADVNRLRLVKQLIDLGHPIGTIAGLPDSTLKELRAAPRGLEPVALRPAAPARRLRVALVGAGFAAAAAAPGAAPVSFEVVAVCPDRAEALHALAGVSADLLAIDLAALRDEAVDQVDELARAIGATRAVVCYRFGTDAAVQALRVRGHVVTQARPDFADLETLAGTTAPAGEAPPVWVPLARVPAPRFDEQTLARLTRAATAIQCECPRHIVDLLLSLGAFERYSAECESRSPADAQLHRELGRVAGTARVLFEDALERVAHAEGLPLDGGSPSTAR